MIVLALVTAGIWRSKALLRAAARTPEMKRAVASYARRQESRQTALYGLEQWIYKRLPGASEVIQPEPLCRGPRHVTPGPERPSLELTGPDVPDSLEPIEPPRQAA